MMMITMCEQVAEEESKVANQHRSSVDMTSHPQVSPACYGYSHDLGCDYSDDHAYDHSHAYNYSDDDHANDHDYDGWLNGYICKR